MMRGTFVVVRLFSEFVRLAGWWIGDGLRFGEVVWFWLWVVCFVVGLIAVGWVC